MSSGLSYEIVGVPIITQLVRIDKTDGREWKRRLRAIEHVIVDDAPHASQIRCGLGLKYGEGVLQVSVSSDFKSHVISASVYLREAIESVAREMTPAT